MVAFKPVVILVSLDKSTRAVVAVVVDHQTKVQPLAALVDLVLLSSPFLLHATQVLQQDRRLLRPVDPTQFSNSTPQEAIQHEPFC
jgi:hypothetical protein